MTGSWRLGAALLLALPLTLQPAASAAQVPPGAVFVVLPFENPRADSRLDWLREGVALLIAEVLDASDVQVVPRAERVLAYDRLQLPVAATLSRASAIKVGQTVGATAVVVGRVELDGDQLLVAARLVQLDAGRLRPEMVVRGPVGDLFATVARVAAALSDKPARGMAVAADAGRLRAVCEGPQRGLRDEQADAPRAGAQGRARVRRRPPGAVGTAHRTGRAPTGARRRVGYQAVSSSWPGGTIRGCDVIVAAQAG
jgi:TolB-like protein